MLLSRTLLTVISVAKLTTGSLLILVENKILVYPETDCPEIIRICNETRVFWLFKMSGCELEHKSEIEIVGRSYILIVFDKN